MWVVFKVYTGVTELGNYEPGHTANLRDADAELVIKRGWALARPDLEKKPEPEPEPEAEPEEEEPELEKEEIETPEDSHPHRKRETATLKRKKKR